jgi:hypothetical protein
VFKVAVRTLLRAMDCQIKEKETYTAYHLSKKLTLKQRRYRKRPLRIEYIDYNSFSDKENKVDLIKFRNDP